MNRRRPAPDYRDEAESLAALYARSDATDDREAGRQQATRARRLADLIEIAHGRALTESERAELGRLVGGRIELSTKTDGVTCDHTRHR